MGSAVSRTLRVRILAAAAAAVIGLISCRRDLVPVSPSVGIDRLPVGNTVQATPNHPGPNRNPRRDSLRNEIARQVPGYGGMYIDSVGDLNVWLTSEANEAVARQVLEPIMRAHIAATRGETAASRAQLHFRPGQFGWVQLEDYVIAIIRLTNLPPWSSLGIDERLNGIFVETMRSGDVDAMKQALQEGNIPAGAVHVRYGGPVELNQVAPTCTTSDSIDQRCRPVFGGLRTTTALGQCTIRRRCLRLPLLTERLPSTRDTPNRELASSTTHPPFTPPRFRRPTTTGSSASPTTARGRGIRRDSQVRLAACSAECREVCAHWQHFPLLRAIPLRSPA